MKVENSYQPVAEKCPSCGQRFLGCKIKRISLHIASVLCAAKLKKV